MLSRVHTLMPQARLTGIDGSKEMLEQARSKLSEAHFVEGDLEETVPDPASYNVVVSLNVLHHVKDQTAYLKALVSALKPGGTMFLCDFAVDHLMMRSAEFYWRLFHPAHHKALSSYALKKMLLEQGMQIVDSKILQPDRFWQLQIYKLSL